MPVAEEKEVVKRKVPRRTRAASVPEYKDWRKEGECL